MRDDLSTLPVPRSVKRYARRKGLVAMQRQPEDYIRMVADVLGQPEKGFRNKDAGQTTAGKKLSEQVVDYLLSGSI